MKLTRFKTYDNAMLHKGWICLDYDFETNEHICARAEEQSTITVRQARLLSYNSVDELSDREYEELFGVKRTIKE